MAAPANAEDESRDRARNHCGQILTESFLFINTDPGIGPDWKRYAPYPQIFTAIASMNTTGYTDSSGRFAPLGHLPITLWPCALGEMRGAPWFVIESAVNRGVTRGANAEARTTAYPRRPSNTKRAWPY